MTTFWLLVGGAVLALAVGVWIGVGAPGWPHRDDGRRRHTQKRPLNPIAWGKSAGRERLEVRRPDDRRRPRLR